MLMACGSRVEIPAHYTQVDKQAEIYPDYADIVIPPTIHYEQPDPECDLNYVPNQALQTTVNAAISNSLGFGGHNATVLIRKYQD